LTIIFSTTNNKSMSAYLNNIRIVLVNPLDSKNVGALCRSMKTMGIGALTIVRGPKAPALDLEQAAVLAVHARDVLENRRTCSSLKEALAGTSLAAGITRRRGKRRKSFALTPEQLAEHVAGQAGGETALVFGNEASGLDDRDLSLCQVAVRIPSSPGFPSLNLSHAVQIITYCLYRALGVSAKTLYSPITREQLDSLVDIILGSLRNIGFFTQVGDDDMGIFFRDILARAALSRTESRRLEMVFRKISGLAARRGVSPR
jgi:tRNA/rRNA methyltransferase